MVDAEWVVVNIVGNFGVFLVIVAYFLLQLKKVQSDSISYLLTNIFGAILIAVSLIFKFNLPAVVIEVCWILISLFGLAQVAYRRFKRRKHISNSTEGTSQGNPDLHSDDKLQVNTEGNTADIETGAETQVVGEKAGQ